MLQGKIKWVVEPGALATPCLQVGAMPMGELMRRMLEHVPTLISGTVTSASYDESTAAWTLTSSEWVVRASATIFASGGWGSVATAEELAELHVHSTEQVHISDFRFTCASFLFLSSSFF